jgi:putative restriction endonuclease
VRYWWVNQNQTYRHEIDGGYLWSPKRNKNNARNPFYESMREVAPGDVIFSFCDTRITALGIARSFCYESPKPQEFGNAGIYWSAIGWRIDVTFRELSNRIHPKSHIAELRRLLPEKYSPLRSNGDGLQSVYLAEIGTAFANALFKLIGSEANQVADAAHHVDKAERQNPAVEPTIDEWERRVEVSIQTDSHLPETTREALVKARRGQGRFRENVRVVECACRITKVDCPEHLIASHMKPWRDSSNDERLDGENGLLLTPTVDHLFDKGFISFEDKGGLIVSPVAHQVSLAKMGITPGANVNVGLFTDGQRKFLDYHRENVLRMSRKM